MSKAEDCYDVSPKEREIAEWKHQRRMLLRREFMKRYHHPTKYSHVDDPAIQRFNALKMNYDKFFKPSIWNFFAFMGFVGSIAGMAYGVTYVKDIQEKRIRTGQVSYAERDVRFW